MCSHGKRSKRGNDVLQTETNLFHYYGERDIFPKILVPSFLSLPRPAFMRVREISDNPDPKTGRYNRLEWTYHSYYVKPGLWNQWGTQLVLSCFVPWDLMCRD